MRNRKINAGPICRAKFGWNALWLAAWTLALLATHVNADDGEVFLRVCTRCHSMSAYVPSQRSAKSWELTIEQMRQYSEPDASMKFSEQEAAAALRFLLSYPEGQALQAEQSDASATGPEGMNQEKPNSPASSPSAEAPAVASEQHDADAQKQHATTSPAHHGAATSWSPAPRVPLWVQGLAKLSGYVAIGLLGFLAASGLMRRHLKTGFRSIHLSLAAIMTVCAVFHSVVFLWRYGSPHILWFWFGLAAMCIILIALIGGTYRRRLGGWLFRMHKAAAWAALSLTILHWVWYFL